MQGLYAGVALDVPEGLHDGSCDGVHYFSAKPGYGIFVRADKVALMSMIRDDTFR